MVAQAPDTKLSEVMKYFMGSGLKNLNAFSDVGKKKAELKLSLRQSLNKEPIDSNTGLAILAVYENDIQSSISFFKRAYEASRYGLNPSINYAHSLFLNEQYSEAIEIYLDAMQRFPNNKNAFMQIINSLERYYFIDECQQIFSAVQGIDALILAEQKNIVLRALEQFNKLNTLGIDVDLFRGFIHALELTFFEYFEFNTSLSREAIFNSGHSMAFYTVKLPMVSDDLEYMSDLLADMNDSLQDKILELIRKNHQIKDVKQMANKIYSYFTLNTDQVVDHANVA